MPNPLKLLQAVKTSQLVPTSSAEDARRRASTFTRNTPQIWTDVPPEILVLILQCYYDRLFELGQTDLEKLLVNSDREVVRTDAVITMALRRAQCTFAVAIVSCRAWYMSGVTLLYAHPRLTSGAELAAFAHTIASSPDLASHVRTLSIAQYGSKDVLRKLRSTPADTTHTNLTLVVRTCSHLRGLSLTCKGELQQSVFQYPVLHAITPSSYLRSLSLAGQWTPIWELISPTTESQFATVEELEFKVVLFSKRDRAEARAGFKWPPLPALRHVRYYSVLQRATTFPCLPTSSLLTHIELYGTDIDWTLIADALPSFKTSLRVLHLIGRYEWRAMTMLSLHEFVELRQLAYGIIAPFINVDFELRTVRFPPHFQKLIIGEWDKLLCISHAEELLEWVRSDRCPPSLEAIHIASGVQNSRLLDVISELAAAADGKSVKVTCKRVGEFIEYCALSALLTEINSFQYKD
jgi:hypothetical protein